MTTLPKPDKDLDELVNLLNSYGWAQDNLFPKDQPSVENLAAQLQSIFAKRLQEVMDKVIEIIDKNTIQDGEKLHIVGAELVKFEIKQLEWKQ
jgi:hypothetical protein